MHYPIRIAPLWRLWLLLFGVTQKSAFAELSEEGLLVRFGFVEYRISLEEIASASLSTWSIWAGVGWRPDLAGTLALIGAPGRAADLRLRERKQLGRSGFPYERPKSAQQPPRLGIPRLIRPCSFATFIVRLC